jgi:hypothetical protein
MDIGGLSKLTAESIALVVSVLGFMASLKGSIRQRSISFCGTDIWICHGRISSHSRASWGILACRAYTAAFMIIQTTHPVRRRNISIIPSEDLLGSAAFWINLTPKFRGYGEKEGDPRQFHPKLRPPVDHRELEIDPRTGMKVFSFARSPFLAHLICI